MTAIFVSTTVLALTCGGFLLGMWLRTVLPEDHLSEDSKGTAMTGIGFIATLTALVLGLITASAKSTFDEVDGAIKQTARQLLTLDRILAHYGPEAVPVRGELQNLLKRRLDSLAGAGLDPLAAGGKYGAEEVADRIRTLEPRTELQRSLHPHATDLIDSLLQARWLTLTSSRTSVPPLFLGLLLFWLTAIFISFGLFAPRNVTTVLVLFISALSVTGAMLLIMEMTDPFQGLLRVSLDPLHQALSYLNR